MKKLLNNPWVVGTLALLAIVFVTRSLYDGAGANRRGAFRGSPEVDAGDDQAGEAAAPVALTPDAIRALVLGLSIPQELPDPFATAQARLADSGTAVEPLVETERIHLSAIWEQTGSTFLLINGRIVRPGETVGRFGIESASLEGAWISHREGREFLRLGGDITLVTTTNRLPSTDSNVALHEDSSP